MKPPQMDLNQLYMAITRDVLSRFASNFDLVVVRDATWDWYHQRSKFLDSESESDVITGMKPPLIDRNPPYMAITRDLLSRFASNFDLVVVRDAAWDYCHRL